MPNNFPQHERQDLLNNLGTGRANAIGARRLAQILGYPIGGNQVRLRSLIKECIEFDGDLIGAATVSPSGFFIISDLQELESYVDSLENRTRSDNQRRTALINSWNRNNTTQTTKQILRLI